MRYCSASAVRILTLFSLLVLVSHSFVPVYAADSAPTDESSVSTPSASPSAPSDTPQVPPSSTPPPSSSPSKPPPSSTPPSSTPHSPSVTPSKPPASSSSPSATPSSTPASSSSSSSSSSSLSSSSSSSSSSTSTSSGTSTTPGTTLVAGPSRNVADDTAIYKYPSGTQPGIVHPTNGPEESGTVSGAASQGTSFFDNKGAVAGTFIAVALVVIGLIAAVIFFLKRRRSRYRDEEDEVYFEKYHEPPMQEAHSPTIGNISGLGDSSHDLSTQSHARVDAYPDRALHHGWTPGPEAEFSNPQDYGVEYPPGTAYGSAQAQQGQYQYSSNQGGTAYNNAGQGYLTTARTSPGPHPFADPNNAARHGAAPPVGYSRSIESHYSNQSAYSGTAY